MSAQCLVEDAKKRAGWSIFTGVLTAACGVFLIVCPLVIAKVSTILLGWVLILVGIAQLGFALHSQKGAEVFLKLLGTALFGITGLALAFAPLDGAGTLSESLGPLLLIQAGLATATALQIRPLVERRWLLFDATSALFLGTLIMLKWPSTSVWAVGALVGVSVLMSGIARIVIAARIRSGFRIVERSLRAA